ncbi:Protein of unknown function, partial [Cotesia congregata]
MGRHKRSRSRDRSNERTSKRLRKLVDNIEDIMSGLAMMSELISAQNAPASVPPETIAPNLEDTDTRVNDFENTNVKNPEVSKDTEDSAAQVTPDSETGIQNESTPGSGDSHKEVAKESSSSEEVEVPWELDADGLRIFGEDPVLKEPELVLHSSVTARWKKYLSDGLTKEVKDSLLKKYPRKGKLSIEPPILNDEVAVNLKESALKTDKYFCSTQKLAGSALAALAPVIESLAPLRDSNHVKNLEQVWNAAKLLIEIHRSQTVARKACILPTLSKQWATALEKRVTDDYLFGEKLVDKVKEIKAISKVGEKMKSAPVKKAFTTPGHLNARSSSGEKKSFAPASRKTTTTAATAAKKPLTSRKQSATSALPESLVTKRNVSTFAGRLQHFVKVWESITEEKVVIQTVKGYKIPFESTPSQTYPPLPRAWSEQESSKLKPERRCKYLGFILDSITMRIELPQEKNIAVRMQIGSLKAKKMLKIRDFAKVVGSVVACCPAVEYSLLHCRLFERAKIQALNKSDGCFDALMAIPKFDDGIGNSTLNSARAALSLISSEDVTNNQLISRFIKGSSKIRPSLPKYESTRD